MIHGDNVILFMDNRQVAGATDCDIDVNQNLLQVCSPVSGRYRTYVSSDCGWSASVNMVVIVSSNPQEWLSEMKSSATSLTIRYFDSNMKMHQVGKCYIKSFSLQAKVGSICTYSLQLQGTGELRVADQRDFPFVIGDTMYTNRPMVAGAPDEMNIGGSVDNSGNWSNE